MGLFLALMIFRDDPALIAVGITSLLLLPTFYRLSTSTIITIKTKKYWDFLKAVWPYTKVYIMVFFGIFFTFAVFAIFLPKLAVNHLFRQQLAILTGGHAITFSWPLFWDLFTWNLQVIMLCFILSLVAGNGAIIFIAWNASVWGTIFGNLAKTAAIAAQANPVIVFILIILSVFPHTFLEGVSYIVATVSGTVLSDGISKEKVVSKKMWLIAKHTGLLLLTSLAILFIACIVETYVLNNFTLYRTIIEIAFPR